ncbi:Polyadenylate-binding protein [Durusdinium trenchii]|uniref:Polyadenylate-binding protein n=1 Tax=Durusdinium trenchii TaxID=1381693 RepID=A0ABP0MSU5_9DINO
MLYEIFNSVGPVASIRVCRDSVSRKRLGSCYVNFHSVSDAERALDTLNYSAIKGRACRIMWSQRDPSLRKSGLGNVFVRNLDRNIDNKALYDTFSLFGNILSCKVSTGPDGKSRGYGFVHYETEEAAKQAIERVDGMQIGEKTVGVGGFTKRSERETPAMNTFTNVYIKNFPTDWDEDSIKTEFGKCGKGRKFAFLNFETHEEAKKAIEEMHQKDFRSDEQKEADKEKEEEEKDRADKSCLLYVARAQSKSERMLELKEKMPAREPAGRSQGVNLYIKNLDEQTDDDSLRGLFESFGNITSVFPTGLHPTRLAQELNGKCKGFGFVCFSSPDEATKAVTEMHLKVVKGKPLYVGLAEKREVRAERLRQRYSPSGVGKGKGKGKGGMGNQMYGNPMGGMGGGMGGCNPPMMGMGGMGKGMMQGQNAGMMMGGQKGKGGMPNMPMNPQMMGMGAMGKGMPNMNMGGAMGKGGMQMPMPMAMPGTDGCDGTYGTNGHDAAPDAADADDALPVLEGLDHRFRPEGEPGMPSQGPAAQTPPAGNSGGGQQLTAAALAAAPPPVQKQMIGERLFPAISKHQPELAGKITGMMLEMDNSELLILLDSEHQLKAKVDEAMRVLEQAKCLGQRVLSRALHRAQTRWMRLGRRFFGSFFGGSTEAKNTNTSHR